MRVDAPPIPRLFSSSLDAPLSPALARRGLRAEPKRGLRCALIATRLRLPLPIRFCALFVLQCELCLCASALYLSASSLRDHTTLFSRNPHLRLAYERFTRLHETSIKF